MGRATAQPLIEFRSATLGYGQKRILSGVSFSVATGDFFGIVGPNGAGKTTIIRTILGMISPLEGEVRVGPGKELRIGYVPQRDTINSILPYTGWEVVMMGRYRQMGILRRPTETDRESVREGLAQVDAMGFACRPFQELSGGQKQRILIARALASRSEILILDEPTNGMDLASRVGILSLIRRLHAGGLTVILVSHLLDDVANHVRRLAIVQEGRFLVGEVGELLTAENLSSLYGLAVDVEHVRGNTVILTGGSHERR